MNERFTVLLRFSVALMPHIPLIDIPFVDSKHRFLAAQPRWLDADFPKNIPEYLVAESKSYGNLERRQLFLQSRLMIHSIIDEKMGSPNDLRILKEDSDKPYGLMANQQIHISISHSSSTVFTIIDPNNMLGIDAELINRSHKPDVRQRIMHPEEKITDDLQSVDTILLWVVKESILKLIGSGLRVSMSSICLQKHSKDRFGCRINDQNIQTSVMAYQHHYLAISEYI